MTVGLSELMDYVLRYPHLKKITVGFWKSDPAK
jgi:hypothetical protein